MNNKGKLCELYKKAGITQSKIAELTGMSSVTISKYLSQDYHGRLYDKLYNCLTSYLEENDISIDDEKEESTYEATGVVKEEKTNIVNDIVNENIVYFPKPERGEIYFVKDMNNEDSDNVTTKNRPALIITTNERNTHSTTVEILYMTLNPRVYSPAHVTIYPKRDGIKQKSTIICEEISMIKKYQLVNYIGKVSDEKMREIDKALAYTLDLKLESEAPKPEIKREVVVSDNDSEKVKLLNEKIKDLVNENSKLQRENKIITAEHSIYKQFFEARIKMD